MVVNHQSRHRPIGWWRTTRYAEPVTADRKQDRHRGSMRGDRFTDDEWERLRPIADHHGVSRTRLIRDYVLYLIGDPAGALRDRPDR